jgi:hypothetical protein
MPSRALLKLSLRAAVAKALNALREGNRFITLNLAKK